MQTINPYPALGTQFTAGMNAIIAGLPGSPTINDLVTQVTTYVESVYYSGTPPSFTQNLEIKSVAYSAINSYVNGTIEGRNSSLYNSSQKSFINMLIGPSLTNYLTVDTIGSRILDIEDNISKSNFKIEDQTPLLFATMIGETVYTYWIAQIALGVASTWNTSYFAPAKVSAIGNVPFWTAAAIEGTLIGAKSTSRGMIQPTTEIVGMEMLSALIGALTIAAGKVVFLWIPRMQNNGGFNNPSNCGCGK